MSPSSVLLLVCLCAHISCRWATSSSFLVKERSIIWQQAQLLITEKISPHFPPEASQEGNALSVIKKICFCGYQLGSDKLFVVTLWTILNSSRAFLLLLLELFSTQDLQFLNILNCDTQQSLTDNYSSTLLGKHCTQNKTQRPVSRDQNPCLRCAASKLHQGVNQVAINTSPFSHWTSKLQPAVVLRQCYPFPQL